MCRYLWYIWAGRSPLSCHEGKSSFNNQKNHALEKLIKHLSPLGGAGGGSSILNAITHYCEYQPRSHKEVRNKLYELGCTTPEVEDNILKLIEAGLLNEEKYARAIARGKFRIKYWGRNKIIEQLRQQQVSAQCIKLGLSEIDEVEYMQVAIKLAEKKWHELKTTRTSRVQQQKVYRYLLQKGYEHTIITAAINETLK